MLQFGEKWWKAREKTGNPWEIKGKSEIMGRGGPTRIAGSHSTKRNNGVWVVRIEGESWNWWLHMSSGGHYGEI